MGKQDLEQLLQGTRSAASDWTAADGTTTCLLRAALSDVLVVLFCFLSCAGAHPAARVLLVGAQPSSRPASDPASSVRSTHAQWHISRPCTRQHGNFVQQYSRQPTKAACDSQAEQRSLQLATAAQGNLRQLCRRRSGLTSDHPNPFPCSSFLPAGSGRLARLCLWTRAASATPWWCASTR